MPAPRVAAPGFNHHGTGMKTLTVNVSEPVYRDLQRFAEARDRTTTEPIREAMGRFRDERIRQRASLRELRPLSLGEVLRPLDGTDDLLAEMLDDQGA